MASDQRFGSLAFLLALLTGVTPGPAFATTATLTVAQDGTGDYSTIQAAVDAANPGDTVFVRNGVYGTGGKEDTFAQKMQNRVFINKSLTLVGESKEKTIIKGGHASTPVDSAGLGLGPDAVRCIGIGANNVVISNLTVTGGATHVPSVNDNCDGNGGGIYMLNGYSGVQIVDCIISNNVAQRAAGIRHGNDVSANHSKCLVARCWFDGNKAANRDPIGRGILLVHSLCTRHYYTSCLFYSVTAVNCTFADGNSRSHNETVNCRSYNCIYADTFYKMDDNGSYNNCIFNHAYNMSPNANTNDCVFAAGYDHFMAPVLNDYRLHDGATFAIGRGDAAYLAQVDLGIPEGCRYTDFYGHAFTPQNGKINIGCSQQAITPAGGKITLAGQSGMSIVQSVGAYNCTMDNGLYSFGENNVPLTQSKFLAYLRAETYPMTLRIRHDASVATSSGRRNGLHSFAASDADTMTRYPLMDGTFVVMAPPVGKALALTPVFNSAVCWVDRASTAEAPDGSEAKPYASLQAAINSIANNAYGTVYVREGTYDNENGTTVFNLANRISSNGRKVRLVSADGIGKATLLGAADPGVALDAWPFGCGARAMRCVYLGEGCAIQGFALTQGHSNTDADTSNGRRGAAIFLAGGAQALDCVITNNVGYQGAALNGTENGKVPTAWAFRCLIADNYPITATTGAQKKFGGTAGVVRSTTLGSCILQNNHGHNFGGYESQYTCQCTIVGGSENGNVVGVTGASINLLVSAPANGFNGQLVYGGVGDFGSGAMAADSQSVVRESPLLADPLAGDYRLGSVSPARTSGVTTHPALTDAQRGDYYMLGATDFNGVPFRFMNGKPVCGAVQTFAPTVVVAGDGIEPRGPVVLASGADRVTFTATFTATRPYLGFVVNGETQMVAQTTFELVIPQRDDYRDAFTVSALYDTNWYVDPTGDDMAYGTAAAPKKTLRGGLEHAIAGDVVHVASGVYKTEKMYQTKQLGNNNGAFNLAARAVVPEGVALIGAGAGTTFIVGESDLGADESAKGCGPNAVRCVALGAGARLSGFTLTGGRTDADGNADNYHGGGVLASYRPTTLPLITDCVISNCVGRRGGGGMFGSYNRCRFFDDAVVNGGNGAAMRGNGGDTAVIRNSVVDRCVGYATLYMVTQIENCTIGAGNVDGNLNSNGATVVNDCNLLENVLVLGGKAVTCGESVGTRLLACAYGPETKGYLGKFVTASDCVEADSLDRLQVDPLTYAPIVDANLGIDAAVAGNYDGGDLDCHGRPRFVNGLRLDIGAVEADWLDAYSKAIGGRVTVTAADGRVERIAGKVTIPAEATLTATVGRAGVDGVYLLKATVAEGGQCVVQKDGADLATLMAGTSETRLRLGDGPASLAFSAAGTGTTVLDSLRSAFGFIVVVR